MEVGQDVKPESLLDPDRAAQPLILNLRNQPDDGQCFWPDWKQPSANGSSFDGSMHADRLRPAFKYISEKLHLFSTYETMKKTLGRTRAHQPHDSGIRGHYVNIWCSGWVVLGRCATGPGQRWILGFLQGFGIRVTVMCQLPLYELLKLQLSSKLNRKPLYAHEAAACGSIAAGVAAALTTPLDVLKTRVMLDTRDASKEKLPLLPSRLRTIYVTEGVKALFAGVVPRTLRISAGGAVFLGVYEWAVHGLVGI
ncbi:mitochondrial carrier domain-containing protein [Flammula alnicola]|nr:mitochondrial carrier domain-containing protein [Flammula alnicola]